MQGSILASNLLKGNHRTVNYTGIPSGLYHPAPGASGSHGGQGLHFVTHHEDTSSWFSSRRVGLHHSGYKTLVEEGTERILGAHLFGDHAEEVINLFALAIRSRIRRPNSGT